MATMPELEKALKGADQAGDTDAARKLAAIIKKARQDPSNLIPGVEVTGTRQTPEPGPSIGEQVLMAPISATETGLAAGTGAISQIGGTLKGIAQELINWEFGKGIAEQEAQRVMEAGTYQPRTEAGQAMLETVGEIAQPLQAVGPMAPELGMAAIAAARGAAPIARAVTEKATAPVRQAVEQATKKPTGAVGAQVVPEELQRRTVAESMPIPFKGESALTKGQASRNFEQLQFEKETAKRGELGEPLRERIENQTATFIQNFDAMVNKLEPFSTEKIELGAGINKALVNKAEVMRKKIRDAYKKAEDAGEMQSPIEMEQLPTLFDELDRFSGVAKNINPIKNEALRIGAIKEGPNGEIIPGVISIKDSEVLRQFVNESTDWMDRRESLMARRINDVIDNTTENVGGKLYRDARKLRAQFADEFENTGLTSKLLGSKRGTTERQVALEDVFDKIFISSSIEEINKLRGTLLKSGSEGKQAWQDVKAAGIDYIKNRALSESQRDSQGNPLLSPDRLTKIINRLDEEGKLVSLYGKKQAQQLRDLAELSQVIYTAPPGAINFSNTASALQVALDSVATFGLTGVPAPIATTLMEASKYVKNIKLKKRIQESLESK